RLRGVGIQRRLARVVVRHPDRCARSLRHAPGVEQVLVDSGRTALVSDDGLHRVGVGCCTCRYGDAECGYADGGESEHTSGSGHAHPRLLTTVFSATRVATESGSIVARKVAAGSDS